MSLVLIDRPEPGIARLCINRPERRNAFDPQVRDALLEACESVAYDDDVRAIVLGSANGVFCAGGDVTGMKNMSPEAGRKRMATSHRLVRMMLDCDKPIVAAVEGYAVGAGAGIALWADTIVLGQGATIGIPFFKLGLVPDYAIFHTLPRRVGLAKARQILLYGRNYKGQAAADIGLADEIVPDADVARTALDRARELAAQPRHAMSITKRQLGLWPMTLGPALEMENMGQSLGFQTKDFEEGRTAFLEKRKPKFG
jgi:2-(1,2-epoxy-1,2-dihydrophenyl)acetyl-CoA isomerase